VALQGERAIKEISKQGEGQQDPMKVSKAKPRNRMSAPGFGAPMSMGHHGGGPGPSFGGRPSVGFQVAAVASIFRQQSTG
jgi:hypothetical protein